MARLVISNGVDTVRFNPQRQYFDIYDYLKDNFGWEHDAADEVLHGQRWLHPVLPM